MRFTIAAAILAQALPTLAQEDATAAVTSVEAATLTLDKANANAFIQKMKAGGRKGQKGFMRNRSPLNGVGKKTVASAGVECKPDVGVLSCGTGKYCKSDVTSSLGGVCAPLSTGGRKLEDMGNFTFYAYGDLFCVDETYAEYYEDCDCTGWDADTSTGDVSCPQYTDYCSYYCPNICYDSAVTYTTDGESFVYSYCTTFTAPMEQEFCMTGTEDLSCEVTLDGEACTSCEFDGACWAFDCDNLGMGSGNTCNYEFPVPPIWYSCAPYDVCEICPDGVVFPDNTVTAGTYVFTCNELMYLGLGGMIEENSCSYLMGALSAHCCGADVYQCNICGEESAYMTLPEAIVTVPTLGDYTCAELYYGAQTGQIPEQYCPLVAGFAAEPCGCKLPGETDAPTMSPTNATMAPTMSPTMAANETMAPTMAATNATTEAPTAAPTAGSGAASKLALTAVACATALVAVFSM